MNPKLTGVLLTMTLAALTACGGGDDKKNNPAPAAGGDSKGAAPAKAGGAAYDAAKAKASVKFTVKWTGAALTPGEIAPGDEYCKGQTGGKVADPRFAVNADGTLPNAFVWALEGPHKGMSGLPDSPKVTLDQKGCMYHPHVFGLRTGAAFTVKNSDNTNHNVHARPAVNKNEINQGQATLGATNDFTFTAKEAAIPFNCDVHTWMSAFAFVLDHPFFGTTGDDGSVTISNLPAGKYTFKVWHESTAADGKGHETKIEVEVGEGESKAVEAALK